MFCGQTESLVIGRVLSMAEMLALVSVWYLPSSFLPWLLQPLTPSLARPEGTELGQTLSKSCWDPTLPLALSFKDYVLSLNRNLKYFDLRLL